MGIMKVSKFPSENPVIEIITDKHHHKTCIERFHKNKQMNTVVRVAYFMDITQKIWLKLQNKEQAFFELIPS